MLLKNRRKGFPRKPYIPIWGSIFLRPLNRTRDRVSVRTCRPKTRRLSSIVLYVGIQYRQQVYLTVTVIFAQRTVIGCKGCNFVALISVRNRTVLGTESVSYLFVASCRSAHNSSNSLFVIVLIPSDDRLIYCSYPSTVQPSNSSPQRVIIAVQTRCRRHWFRGLHPKLLLEI